MTVIDFSYNDDCNMKCIILLLKIVEHAFLL